MSFRNAVEKGFEDITDSDLCWGHDVPRSRWTLVAKKHGTGKLWDELNIALTKRSVRILRVDYTDSAEGGGAISHIAVNEEVNVKVPELVDLNEAKGGFQKPPAIEFIRAEFRLVLWHELGHALYGNAHEKKPWNFYNEGHKDPKNDPKRDPEWGKRTDLAILFENRARQKLHRRFRAPFYYGYK